ncbi:hypothetical protein HAX54_044492, partial [Datura stramonium]|nr:hypothetical protein [Datura stramonium]
RTCLAFHARYHTRLAAPRAWHCAYVVSHHAFHCAEGLAPCTSGRAVVLAPRSSSRTGVAV